MERSRLDRGEESFLSKSMRVQSGQMALHRFRFLKISQNLHLFDNLWLHVISPWHFCLTHQQCCLTNPEGWIPIHSFHQQEAEEAEGESTPLPTKTGTDGGKIGCCNHKLNSKC
ncbi:unnamed protein product [Prunus armeniaca]